MILPPPVKTFTPVEGVTFAAPFLKAEVMLANPDGARGMRMGDEQRGWGAFYTRYQAPATAVPAPGRDLSLVQVSSGFFRASRADLSYIRPVVYRGRVALEMGFSRLGTTGLMRVIDAGGGGGHIIVASGRGLAARAVADSLRFPEGPDPTAAAALKPAWRTIADESGTVRAEVPGVPMEAGPPQNKAGVHFTRFYMATVVPIKGEEGTPREFADRIVSGRSGAAGKVMEERSYRLGARTVSSFRLRMVTGQTGRLDLLRDGDTLVSLFAFSYLGPLESPETSRFFGSLR